MLCDTKPTPFAPPADSLYKRPLPPEQIPFASAQGRLVFQEALLAGTMHGYFPLAEQFHTQVEPTYCGISSLVMVLNALQVDPKRLWKGVWRWFSEDLADCCHQLDLINREGMTLDSLATLARCNGLSALAVHADAQDDSFLAFRRLVLQEASAPGDDGSPRGAVIVSYSRKILGQTGDGHFSPIGGYHVERNLVLLLDVARFKYPPHWVELGTLWQAMNTLDADSDSMRGYVHLRTEFSTLI